MNFTLITGNEHKARYGYGVTRAEMTEADYARTSYRKFALHKLKEHLQK